MKRRKGRPGVTETSAGPAKVTLAERLGIARWRQLTERQKMAAGIAAVVAYFAFVFSNTNGDLSLRGDDILFMAHVFPFRWDYFSAVAGRAYLTPFYTLVYDVAGQSSHWTHLFWFAVFGASALLLFGVLRRFTGNGAAALGAMFYIGYMGKWETLTWASAGAYVLISLVLFAAVWIGIREQTPLWRRALYITLLVWAGTLLCEVLIVLAPLYPLIEWIQRRCRKIPTRLVDLLPTLLPSLGFAAHASIIYAFTPPTSQGIWFRGERSHGAAALANAAWQMFQSGVSMGFGSKHWTLVSVELERFWKMVPIGVWGWGVLALALAGVLLLWWQRRREEDHHVALWLLGGAGCYLVLISPVVGFTTNDGVVPSRLLTMTGIGLAAIVGVLASLAMRVRAWLGLPLLAVLGYFTFAEGCVMNDILYQHQTSWACDKLIRSQIRASGIRPQQGDGIFVSLPRDGRWSTLWSIGGLQFEGGHAGVLVVQDFGMVSTASALPIEDRLRYWGWVRLPYERRVPVPLPVKSPFCFWVDDLYRVRPGKCAVPARGMGEYVSRVGAGSLYEE